MSTAMSIPKLPDTVLADLEPYFEPGEKVIACISPESGELGRLGELWLVLTDIRLYYHTKESGKNPVIALLPRSDLASITYFQHSRGITLTFTPRSSPRSISKITFPKTQRAAVENFCEPLASLIIFEAEKTSEPVSQTKASKPSTAKIHADVISENLSQSSLAPTVAKSKSTPPSAPLVNKTSTPSNVQTSSTANKTETQLLEQDFGLPAPLRSNTTSYQAQAKDVVLPQDKNQTSKTAENKTYNESKIPTSPSPLSGLSAPNRQSTTTNADKKILTSVQSQQSSVLTSDSSLDSKLGKTDQLGKTAHPISSETTPSNKHTIFSSSTSGVRLPAPGGEVRLALGEIEGPGFRFTIIATLAALTVAFLWYSLFRILSGSK